jgi:acyl-CoA thioester hydrolase
VTRGGSGGGAGAVTRRRSRVEWVDTDAAGIAHNTAVNRLVEAAEAQLVRELGLDGYFPVTPRVRFEADFESPLHFEDVVETTLRVARVGESSLEYDFEVWAGEAEGSARRAARGRYVVVHVELGADGRAAGSTPWPSPWAVLLRGEGRG